MKQSENLEIMKTTSQSLIISVAIFTTLFLFIASVAFGSELKPDNNIEVAPPEIVFEEEEYIDDIPFDTQAIAEAYLLNGTMNVQFDFEEEAYIDDIPFNTERIFNEVFFTYYYKK